jgi:hypothetical protein
VLDVINRAGAEAFKIAVGALPMLVLSLTVVLALRRLGALDSSPSALPALLAIGADPALLLPTLTKFLAGGTAMMGVMDEMLRAGTATTATLNGASAGLLVHPLDIPGVAVLLSAGRRVAAVWKPAALGAWSASPCAWAATCCSPACQQGAFAATQHFTRRNLRSCVTIC